jgi:hypothetical protein
MSEEEVKLLNIKKLQRNDTGDYLCRVLNEYGLADLIHHLIVLPGKSLVLLISFFLIKYFCFQSLRTSIVFEESFKWHTPLYIE